MILSAQSIQSYANAFRIIDPFIHYEENFEGISYGLGPASYSVRIKETMILKPHGFVLASIIEKINLPNNLMARVCDKSTWARLGLAVQNTTAKPGWCGYLTLELKNNSERAIELKEGMGIAEIEFNLLDYPTTLPYRGKYQNQASGPQPAKRG